MPSVHSLSFSSLERERLARHASEFGLELQQPQDGTLRIVDAASALEVELSEDLAWTRVLSEICSRSAPWLCFRVGVNAKTTLLSLSDEKLARIAHLYCLDRPRASSSH